MIEICVGAIATAIAVFMTHLQSGWLYGKPLPSCLLKSAVVRKERRATLDYIRTLTERAYSESFANKVIINIVRSQLITFYSFYPISVGNRLFHHR